MMTRWTETTTRTVASDGAGLSILIVDDNFDCVNSTAILLRLFGHSVDTANNGTEALVKARADKPDVVLLDLGLPGMSGYDLARALSAPRPEKTPFLVAVTGYGQEEDRRESLASGIDLHLLKPVDPVQLRLILETFQWTIEY